MTRPFWLTEDERKSAEDILNQFAIEDGFWDEDGKQNIFQIGCFSGRVTIASQQQRALNLVWCP